MELPRLGVRRTAMVGLGLRSLLRINTMGSRSTTNGSVKPLQRTQLQPLQRRQSSPNPNPNPNPALKVPCSDGSGSIPVVILFNGTEQELLHQGAVVLPCLT